MNKEELINQLASKSGATKETAGKVLEAFIETVMQAVKNKDEVRLLGFGTFGSLERQAREGVNPSTREKIQIPASTRPKFSPGKSFIDLLNKK